MNRSLTILTRLAIVLAVGEALSAVTIAVEDYAGSVPAFPVLFGVLFLTAAWLLHNRRAIAGASLVGFLCLFELITFAGWQKHNAFDWTTDVLFVVLSAVTLGFAIRVLVTRRRSGPVNA